ncbi:uncharacterized protein TRIADDRAFT_56786 [Trichoplax adhaerens]|uniref:Interferon-related developmental regulator N-terminal domain-containing protein n=1 Tax=Trichoplax adhaerens TaxID=10228 RepID=B3RWK9_TRIAD|nr:hypothetical protein TRIADDRAFT_56786 [Trichoplax adhaerens]EDV24709.1 hypothetical protein TRIADDRAFT_56786 [Trichoplax adhaerens]|eukprot:XP_002112599.1 hypothetical protein TRIADDRAFT_56786 [Trichoplax adhaerens]
MSTCSSFTSKSDEELTASGGETENAQVEIENALVDAIEELYDKRMKATALQAVNKILSKSVMTEFVEKRQETLASHAEKYVKKGQQKELELSTKLMSLLFIQLGTDSSRLFSELKPTLMARLRDTSLNPSSRASCITALGLLTFVAADSPDTMDLMETLEAFFYFTDSKLDGIISASLSAWSLLLSAVQTPSRNKLIHEVLPKLKKSLGHNNVDVRIAAGETIALVCEVLNADTDDIYPFDEICTMLEALVADSSKRHAKKDRAQQRSAIRDVLHYIRDGQELEECVKFGQETLDIDCWSRRVQYNYIRTILGGGTNAHLQSNEFVREVFDLGKVLPADFKLEKGSRSERNYYNSLAAKARTKARSVHRDKRADVY